MPSLHSLVSMSTDHVIVETIKRAEECVVPPDCDGDGWIVRVYDWQQRRSEGVRLKFGRAVKHAVACNLIETVESPVRYEGEEIVFDIKPFEIRTFKVWL